jgi:hypothetical protein
MFAFEVCDYYPRDVINMTHVGHLYFGGYPSSRVLHPIQWTPLPLWSIYPGYYVVTIERLTIGSQVIDFPNNLNDGYQGTIFEKRMVIVDSGTTRLYFNTDANAKAFMDAILPFVTFPAGTNQTTINTFVHNMTAIMGATFDPKANITVAFNGASARILMSSIFEETPEGLIQNGVLMTGMGLTILGDTFFRGNVLVFDQQNQRLGMAPAVKVRFWPSRMVHSPHLDALY